MAFIVDYKDKDGIVTAPLEISDRQELYYGLERALCWMKSKDIAIVTAFRDKLEDETEQILDDNGNFLRGTLIDREITEGKEGSRLYSKKENLARNKDLKTALLSLGFGVTKVHGYYEEGNKHKPVIEDSFFVVNLHDDENFFDKVFFLSEKYNQQAFLAKEKTSDDAYFIGTNNYNNGYNKEELAGTVHINATSQFMTKFSQNTSIVFK